jgi:hypothetical protein
MARSLKKKGSYRGKFLRVAGFEYRDSPVFDWKIRSK